MKLTEKYWVGIKVINSIESAISQEKYIKQPKANIESIMSEKSNKFLSVEQLTAEHCMLVNQLVSI